MVGMTGLGLIEMTRKKVRQDLSSIMHVDCPYYEGSGRLLASDANGKVRIRSGTSYRPGRQKLKSLALTTGLVCVKMFR